MLIIIISNAFWNLQFRLDKRDRLLGVLWVISSTPFRYRLQTTRLWTEIVIQSCHSLVTIRKHCTKSVEAGVSGTGAGANWKFERARPLSSTRGRVRTSDRHFTRPAPSPAALALFSFHLFQILFAPFVNLRVPHRITFSVLVFSWV